MLGTLTAMTLLQVGKPHLQVSVVAVGRWLVIQTFLVIVNGENRGKEKALIIKIFLGHWLRAITALTEETS